MKQMKGGYPSFDGADDMARRLNEALRDVEEHAFRMNRAIDSNDTKEAIKSAQQMLRELRAGSLSPKTYYELWMKIFDHLRQLYTFLLELAKKGESIADLYQHVQGGQNIIPRLYLMITVGSVFITTKGAPATDVLQDLIEMTKGVQHPLRGLFLRNYLLKMTQDLLTQDFEVPTEYCVKFILQNLGEMNRLWVRMQHQGNARNKQRREKERMELKVLISFNLVRLSELDDMDLETYQSIVLEQVIEIITNCKDRIAQQYLMDVLVQVFPASYHLATLTKIYGSFEHLEPDVDLKAILLSLMTRIKYLGDEGPDDDVESSSPVGPEAFQFLKECVSKMLETRKSMSILDQIDLYVALLEFAVSCYPGELMYIDEILGACVTILDTVERISLEEDDLVLELLRVPLRQKQLGSLQLLQLSYYPTLMSKMTWSSKTKIAHSFLNHVLRDPIVEFSTEDDTVKLLSFLQPLLRDDENSTDEVSGLFEDQQRSVAKLVHKFHNKDAVVLFKILGLLRKEFGKGGVRRIKFTLLPLCFRYILLVRMVLHADGTAQVILKDTGAMSIRKIFQYVHEIASALAGVIELQDLSLRMFLHAAQCADMANESEIAYEFLTQAFTLYEDIADSKEQLRTLPLLIGTLQTTRVFDKESYVTLITKTTQYAVRLLKKPDQVQMVYSCAHLFWSSSPDRQLREGEEAPAPGKDSKRALECLQRSLKIADTCVASHLHVALFVKILNRYVYFLETGMEKITVQNVGDLITLIKRNMADMGENADKVIVEKLFANTVKHLIFVKEKEPGKFEGLVI